MINYSWAEGIITNLILLAWFAYFINSSCFAAILRLFLKWRWFLSVLSFDLIILLALCFRLLLDTLVIRFTFDLYWLFKRLIQIIITLVLKFLNELLERLSAHVILIGNILRMEVLCLGYLQYMRLFVFNFT